MKRPKLAVTDRDKPIAELVGKTGHKALAVWAADCAERALPVEGGDKVGHWTGAVAAS